ncbi:MAG: radical SAM protein [Lactobacillales bacterium]|nr:radical SAM protein [Lactobacillales bacterium]
MYKKIYLEITNNCNLNCDFCIKNKRNKKYMEFDEFKLILEKIKEHANYLYFHILGEPLMHPNINEFIDYASSNFKINITTNGYLINRIKNNKNIRQLNISLHSFDEKYNISLDKYMNNIFDTIDKLNNTYIQLRFWVNNKNSKNIIDMINKRYNINIDLNSVKNNTRLKDNIFISISEYFDWPSLDNEFYSEEGKCYALKDHIGILVDGTVVPCCLDSLGNINLGNIFNEELNDIINKDRYQTMINNFKNNKKCEELCKRCNFL